MKVYVAGELSDIAAVTQAQRTIVAAGHELTHDWSQDLELPQDYASRPDRSAAIARTDLDAVLTAEAVVVLASSAQAGRGLFVELGAALARAELGQLQHVVVVGEIRHESVFHFHPRVLRVGSVEEWLATVEASTVPADRPALRPRSVVVRPFPPSRRLVTAAVRAGRRMVPMHGLVEVDVTEARRLLVDADPPLSLTAFVVASVGRAAAAHPQVHAYRDWRGRLVEHHFVDVQTLIEVPTGEGPFGLVHVVRDADTRAVDDVTAEIRSVQHDADSTTGGRLLRSVAPALGHVPGLYPAMYAALGRSRRAHLSTGTVQVTAVGMFAGGDGFAIAPPTLASLSIVVGGLSRRPRAVGDDVVVRDVLDLTVTIDHNVVDGAPATRFVAELRHLLTTAAVLTDG
ncbi:2-oxo acid dehydrogenase subunit E2 [Humibacillus xanthopallidus]|uniref:2-oxo acid dehydrogenase subunit E2 n=1 Tax=Humibacillus xanthopallidus TaxID=412689 RepID=UPI00384FDBAF